MDQDKNNVVNVLNDRGASMMCIRSIGTEDDQMTVVGSLLGAWESTMYVQPEEVPKMIKLLLNWKVIGYILTLPLKIQKRKKQKNES